MREPTPGESARSHAGVESDGLTVVVFETEEELRGILGTIGMKVDEAGHLRGQTGDVLACSSCDKEVHVGQVGHILPGSTYVYCKDPVCVLDYMERFG
ncbi:MAG: hypothetical protein ACRD6W_06445 [Nitrososphaerales archaeon]